MTAPRSSTTIDMRAEFLGEMWRWTLVIKKLRITNMMKGVKKLIIRHHPLRGVIEAHRDLERIIC